MNTLAPMNLPYGHYVSYMSRDEKVILQKAAELKAAGYTVKIEQILIGVWQIEAEKRSQ